jgi:putative tryptophan/tyrosine transport system substrate-binding protein
MTSRRVFLAGAVTTLAAPLAAEAQAGKIYRIGVLSPLRRPSEAFLAGFWAPLAALGWVEGQNFVFEARYAEGDYDRFPAMAADIVRLQVDLIVAYGERAALAAKEATTTIPIVMAFVNSPVQLGLAASLARPGGNVTGLTDEITPEILGKQLQLLKEAVPMVSRVAILSRTVSPGDAVLGRYVASMQNAYQGAAKTLGVALQTWRVQTPSDIDQAFAEMVQQRMGAVWVEDWGILRIHSRQIIDRAAQHRVPAAFGRRLYAEDGGLMAYGMDERAVPQRLAVYVDKILKGAKPGDLPIEQPTKFEFVINLKTAKALGLTIPPAVLARADEVIQ